ncbi:DUF3800 domain-containing protein [Candidatus Bathyarchaeota archaeon]|nr:DUF3800 domain-containing protein [Candidatus Bathyarchaeota archaeon]
MQLFYCDESGTSLSREALPKVTKDVHADQWYFLGALAIPETLRTETYGLVIDLKNQYLTSLAPFQLLHEKSIESELKGSRLFQIIESRTQNLDLPLWRQLRREQAEEMVDRLIQGLIGIGLAGSLYVVGVEQRLLYRKYFRIARPAAFTALAFLQQRACSRLTWNWDTTQHLELGAFIVDRGSAVERQMDVVEFLSTRDQISLSLPTPPEYDRWLLENPLAVVSSDCPQIQICDILTYIVARAVRENNPAWSWFNRVLPLIASRSDGTRSGIGITLYPHPEAAPSGFVEI